MKDTYTQIKEFMRKYPFTIAWRLKQHCKIIDKHLNPSEKVLYAFAGQKNEGVSEIFNTYVIVLTNKRLMLATKRTLFGYFFKSITPDLYNDLTIHKGLLFGRVVIDTAKEIVVITNIDPKALGEIETNISEIMMKNKKEYAKTEKKEKDKD